MKKIILILLTFFLALNILNAEEVTGKEEVPKEETKENVQEEKPIIDMSPNSKSSILIEASTGKIIFEKNIHEKLSPASMTKIMTLLLVSEAIDSGRIKITDKVLISKHASSMGGSQVWIEEGVFSTVNELLHAVGIASANDATVALAEYLSGSEEHFVELMNKRALQLGATETNFKNSHGLDEANHYSSSHDMSLFARELVKHKDILKITGTYENEFKHSNGKTQWMVNTNTLIKVYPGMDGLKTGYTEEAGYCLTTSAVKNNMRLISVVMKADTKENRSADSVKLLEYGYSQYGVKQILNKDKSLGKIYIDKSVNKYTSYYLVDDVKLLLSKDDRNATYNYKINLKQMSSPLKKNSVVGNLILKYNDNEYSYNLIIKENIKKANYFKLLINNIKDIISGKINISSSIS